MGVVVYNTSTRGTFSSSMSATSVVSASSSAVVRAGKDGMMMGVYICVYVC